MIFWALLEFKDLFINEHTINFLDYKNIIFYLDGWAVAATSFYLIELTNPGWINYKKMFVLMAPFVGFTTFFFFKPSPILFILYCSFIVLYSITTIVIIVISAIRYRKQIHNYYSYAENLDLSWLIQSMTILLSCLLIWGYTNIITVTSWGDTIYYLLSIVFWAYIIHHTCKMENIDMEYEEEKDENGESKNRKEIAIGSEHKDDYGMLLSAKEMLQKVMNEDKLYLNAKLTISDVANAIGTNRTYLSNYFNNTLHTTFYDYINNYRIENISKPLLVSNHPLLSIEEVAEKSGFNSVSTFRRAFIKNTGMTPIHYRKTMLQ